MLNKDLYERYLQKKAKKLGISVEELKGESKPQNESAPQKIPNQFFSSLKSKFFSSLLNRFQKSP